MSALEVAATTLKAKRAGLLGGRKALQEENDQLRAALEGLGLLEREQLQAEVERLKTEREIISDELNALRSAERERLRHLSDDADREIAARRERAEQELNDRLARRSAEVNAGIETAEQRLSELRASVIDLSDSAILQEAGIYEYRHPLDSAISYKGQLAQLQDLIKTLVKNQQAVIGSTNWTVNGSKQQGSKMVKEFSKLMLRAYNNEADNAVRSMKSYKLDSSIARLEKSRTTISKLGRTMSIEVTDTYHSLRIKELELTADYLAKVAEEKERERAERARMREEEKAQRELEAERERLRKEAAHYSSVIETLRLKGDEQAATKAEEKLSEIESAISGVDYRAANIGAGYVYVISNRGSFGERMVKVGLTRRLDPMDRVRELGDASVPFQYDVHALIFSKDAVTLEGQLHAALNDKRVNLVNARREFFYATPEELRELLASYDADLLSFEVEPEAIEWRQSENIRTTSDVVS